MVDLTIHQVGDQKEISAFHIWVLRHPTRETRLSSTGKITLPVRGQKVHVTACSFGVAQKLRLPRQRLEAYLNRGRTMTSTEGWTSCQDSAWPARDDAKTARRRQKAFSSVHDWTSFPGPTLEDENLIEQWRGWLLFVKQRDAVTCRLIVDRSRPPETT